MLLSLLFKPFKQCLDFSGRATRTQFWGFTFGWALLGAILTMALGYDAKKMSDLGATITGIIAVIFFITQISLTVRRLHDSDRSGWWWFIQLIPVIGVIWIIVLMCLGNTKGSNKYGPEVK